MRWAAEESGFESCPRHEYAWRSGGIDPRFFTSPIDGGEWSVSRLGRFTPGDWALGTHRIRDWVGPRSGLDTVEKIISPSSALNRNPAVHPVASNCSDWAIPAHIKLCVYFGMKIVWFYKYSTLYKIDILSRNAVLPGKVKKTFRYHCKQD
jgi:hypothetical protein